MTTPKQVDLYYDWAALLALLRVNFAYMDGRIDPPSSLHRLTLPDLSAFSESDEIWVIECNNTPIACVFLTKKQESLYLGRLCVDRGWRVKSLAHQLVDLAADRAAALGYNSLTLDVRIELGENQAAFKAMGFKKTAELSHQGFDKVTYYAFSKAVSG